MKNSNINAILNGIGKFSHRLPSAYCRERYPAPTGGPPIKNLIVYKTKIDHTANTPTITSVNLAMRSIHKNAKPHVGRNMASLVFDMSGTIDQHGFTIKGLLYPSIAPCEKVRPPQRKAALTIDLKIGVGRRRHPQAEILEVQRIHPKRGATKLPVSIVGYCNRLTTRPPKR